MGGTVGQTDRQTAFQLYIVEDTYIYIYIYIYVYVYIYNYIYIYIYYIYIYIYIYIYVYTYIYIHMYIYRYAEMQLHMHALIKYCSHHKTFSYSYLTIDSLLNTYTTMINYVSFTNL